jgi:RimJ/RimL family protein N-acetyltransferase
MNVPVLRTRRLTLRPFSAADAPAVQAFASAREIALNTLLIPHPYPDGAAAAWIATHSADFENDRIHHFAIDDGQLTGTIGLVMKEQGIAEIGYWIAVPYWGRGYATEAAAEVVRYGFEERNLQRVFACHFTRNPASGRVLRKIGMTYEGTLRQHVRKWDEYVDVAFYGVLRHEYDGVSRV